jgi:hypothetical protein
MLPVCMKAQAVSENQTLESMRIRIPGNAAFTVRPPGDAVVEMAPDNAALVEQVLSHLGWHRSLQELRIDAGYYGPMSLDHMRALVRCLQSTRMLKRLKFSLGKFTTEVLDLLVDGVCENQTVKCLDLDNCSYESLDPLFRLLHSGQTASWSPSLSELVIRGDPMLSTDQSVDTHIASFLFNSPPGFPTVGSLLQSVEFECMDDVGWLALIRGLPRAVHLRNLVIHFVNDGCSARMARALRQNGSLHFVSILDDVIFENGKGSDDTYFRPREYRLVGAYCHRNKHLPSLLAKVDKKSTKNVRLPSLLGVAVQATRLAPTNLLLGLLSSMENIGPGCLASKRLLE